MCVTDLEKNIWAQPDLSVAQGSSFYHLDSRAAAASCGGWYRCGGFPVKTHRDLFSQSCGAVRATQFWIAPRVCL